jgi:hypothetical protein
VALGCGGLRLPNHSAGSRTRARCIPSGREKRSLKPLKNPLGVLTRRVLKDSHLLPPHDRAAWAGVSPKPSEAIPLRYGDTWVGYWPRNLFDAYWDENWRRYFYFGGPGYNANCE